MGLGLCRQIESVGQGDLMTPKKENLASQTDMRIFCPTGIRILFLSRPGNDTTDRYL